MKGARSPEPPHADVVRLYVEERWSLPRLASFYQVAQTRVRAILRSEGVTIRPPGGSAGRVPEPPHADVARFYRDEGWPLARVGRHYGISVPRVRAILRSEGVAIRPANQPPRHSGPRRKPRVQVPPEQARAIADAYRAGVSIIGIAQRRHMSAPLVRRILVEQGVTIRLGSMNRPVPTVDPDQVIAYYQAGNTLGAVAERFGMASTGSASSSTQQTCRSGHADRAGQALYPLALARAPAGTAKHPGTSPPARWDWLPATR